ncbi:hypothetical protein [Paenibacillus luteus]|uniref:hypothetical protein n=1 Tax=Paenibacillus luteus TaxID=2545753 RepID=UPI001143521A|nr:hypothetical protein [Paenibacillus luteus]
MFFDENCKLGHLLNNPAATTILEKYLPGISATPAVFLIHAYTLKELEGFQQANLSPDKVKAIAADLAAIKA